MSQFVEDWTSSSALKVIAIAYTDLDSNVNIFYESENLLDNLL